MKYEESMRIILKNSNGEEFLYELEDKESIKEIKRIVEEIKSLDESRIGILTRTRDGFFLDIEQKYFTRQAPKSISLTEEEQREVE